MDEWFIVNVADAPALHHQRAGTYVRFEPPGARFPEIGVNIHLLQPGEPNGKYHAEEAQEDFLVLFGECLVIIEGEERGLGAWDFVHCPAGTEHIFVGAGDGTCAILMIGARGGERAIHYPVSEAAARHGASVTTATSSAAEAYADWPGGFTPTRIDWPPA
jgi:uncharacterized cupin superfamily protein